MNTCKTCKYWGDGRPSDKNTHNECGFISTEETPNSKDAAFIHASADDDSNLNVKFMTVSTFGCTLHSIKS